MAVLKIMKLGVDDVLRKKAHPVKLIDRRTQALLKDMAETMYAAEGVGLAAPQVGILRRIAVIDVGDGLVELINPEIISAEGAEVGPEGCLSVPGRRGTVERPTKVVVRALDRKGRQIEFTAEGFFARAVCHELDHLDGIVYVDKMIEDVTEQMKKEEEGEV
ncbi:MAG: peptide deformylase [Clostridia bacterium]|nr:peptide deformylase [Clostridia bacterium]MBO4884321.1 peptide deformylase [Clostridia bacterium]MBR4442118.1 peptide deformylase [Clostridia bacterium]